MRFDPQQCSNRVHYSHFLPRILDGGSIALLSAVAMTLGCGSLAEPQLVDMGDAPDCSLHSGFLIRGVNSAVTTRQVEVIDMRSGDVVSGMRFQEPAIAFTAISSRGTMAYTSKEQKGYVPSLGAGAELRIVDVGAGDEVEEVVVRSDGGYDIMPFIQIAPDGVGIAAVVTKGWAGPGTSIPVWLANFPIENPEQWKVLCALDDPVSRPVWNAEGTAICIRSGSRLLEVSSQNGVVRELLSGEPCVPISYGGGAVFALSLDYGELIAIDTLSRQVAQRSSLPLLLRRGKVLGADSAAHVYYAGLRYEGQGGSRWPALAFPAGGWVVRCFASGEGCECDGHAVLDRASVRWGPAVMTLHSGSESDFK